MELVGGVLLQHDLVYAFHIEELGNSGNRFRVIFSKPGKRKPIPATTVFLDVELLVREETGGGSVKYRFEGQSYERTLNFLLVPKKPNEITEITGEVIQNKWIDHVYNQKCVSKEVLQ